MTRSRAFVSRVVGAPLASAVRCAITLPSAKDDIWLETSRAARCGPDASLNADPVCLKVLDAPRKIGVVATPERGLSGESRITYR